VKRPPSISPFSSCFRWIEPSIVPRSPERDPTVADVEEVVVARHVLYRDESTL
jgi:hypothetical protein